MATKKMTHPGSDQTIEVNADQVDMYASQGWETSPKAKPPTEDGSSKK